MSRPACEGAGKAAKPNSGHAGYSGQCSECGRLYRVNKAGEVFNHKVRLVEAGVVQEFKASCTMMSTEPGLSCPLCTTPIVPGVVHHCEASS